MIIKNITKNRILVANSMACDDVFSKLVGLMFSKKQKKGLILKFGNEDFINLHMFFVFYSIDVLFLNKNNIVVNKKENFKPFAFCKSKKKAMYAIEMPNGVIKKTKTCIGDKIGFYSE